MDEDDKEKPTTAAYPTEMLYVVESIILNKCESLGTSDPLKPVLVPGKSKKQSYRANSIIIFDVCSSSLQILLTSTLTT